MALWIVVMMSLDKAIKYGKEKRKPYYRNKRIDPSCRNHGACSWCRDGRLHNSKKRELMWKDEENESICERR